MMDFGKALRAAREAKGLTIAQLAETTRLAPTTITSLENGDIQRIAAPIYGRGFVRLYCSAVGLDPKPFVAEYMEIMQGNREPAIKERAPVMAEPLRVAEEPVPSPTAAEPPERQEPVFRQRLSQPAVPPAHNDERSSDNPSLSRYTAPLQPFGLSVASTWRLIVLAVAAGIVLALLIFGLRALHRTTSPNKTAETTPAETAETVPTPAERVQQTIPALYID